MIDRGRVLRDAGCYSKPVRDASKKRALHGRVLLVLFFATAIAALGLLTGGEHPEAGAGRRHDPMRDYYPSAMPSYPEARELPIGSDTRAGGSTTRMSQFKTKDTPGQVADFYKQFWTRRGMWVREDVTHKGGYVSAVDPSGGHVYQILIKVEAGGRTEVFPSVTDAPLKALDSKNGPVPVELYEGSEVLMNLSTEAGLHEARTILSVNQGSVAQNLAHYRAALAAAGYREDATSLRAAKQLKERAPQMLVYEKASGGEITVSITALDARRTRVHLMQIGE